MQATFQIPPSLRRYPEQQAPSLQAWDRADELLLKHVSSIAHLSEKKILILQDSWGALSCALKEFKPTSYTDSFLSATAIELNSQKAVSPLHSLHEIHGLYDLVLMRIPKNLSFFEDLLATLTTHLLPHAQIICASMVKHLSKGSFDLLNRYLGTTTTSLAEKKARLIFTNFDKQKIKSPYPSSVKIEGFAKNFTHHSHLFSREKLDQGTRFFLEHVPRGDFKRILDLGCANGIIGIKAKEIHPSAQLIFSDESAMAIESARANYSLFFKDEALFRWTHGCETEASDSLDLVLCNPPFHQQFEVGDSIALLLFKEAHRALKKNGILLIIGNTHLGYEAKLKKIFGKSTRVASNAKFSIVEARK